MSTTIKNTTVSDCIAQSKNQPICPDCGALECLCRPRFFAGQLLTEQDLNRLDQYIKKKSRLQNRHLHGWGVVNGLMVLCDPCGQIKVTKGYALDPCGNDVVVCQDTVVDICDLIRKCKERERVDWQCQPFQRPPASDCEALEEDWILAIRYCEQPTRGITALRNTGCTCGQPTSACSCTGSAASGSGSGSSANGSSSGQTPGLAPQQCEPTIVCEGHAFDVCRKPVSEDPRDGQEDDEDPTFEGPLYDRFMYCYNALAATLLPFPGTLEQNEIIADNTTMTAWQMWCCRVRENLMNYFQSHATVNCRFLEIVSCVTCPDPGAMDPDTFGARVLASVETMGLIFIQAMYDCLCRALLPPAPNAAHDPRVPLAVVRVRPDDCKIMHICNWTIHRKLLTTWPAISYWSSPMPIGTWLQKALEQICCQAGESPICPESGEDPSGGAGNTAAMRLNPIFRHADEIAAFFYMASLNAARGSQPQDPRAFLNSVSRFDFPTQAEGLEPIEGRNLPQFLLMNTLARPLGLPAIKPETVANFLKLFDPNGLIKRAAGIRTETQNDLIERVAALEKQLKSQAGELKSLKAQKAKK